MKVYLVQQCETADFKKYAKKNVKVQEIEFYAKTSSVLIEKDKSEAIKDCRRWNKDKDGFTQYVTEIKLYE